MKKFYFFATLMLLTSLSFAQYSTKQQASTGKVSKQTQAISTGISAHNSRATLFSENFESSSLATNGWTTIDQDGDTFDWSIYTSATAGFNSPNCITSASWVSGTGAITPENWLISKAIDLTTATGTVTLDYQVSAQDPDWEYEHYKVVVSTTGTAITDFTNIAFEETLPQVGATKTWLLRSVNLSAYVGQTIHLAWVHYNCTDMYQLNIDDIQLYENTTIDAGITAVTAPDNTGACQLTNAENVTVTIFNYGGADINSIDVTYDINGTNPVTETATITIPAGGSANYTFTQTADLSVLGYYTMNFSVALASDANATNDTWVKKVNSTDASIIVKTLSDSQGSQTWTIKDSQGTTIADGGNYQWNVQNTITACVIANECYTFTFSGFDATGWIEVSYNGTVVGGSQTAGNSVGGVTYYGIGGACAAVDAKLSALTFPAYAQPGNVNISGEIKNIGTSPITSFDVTYNINGGTESAIYSVTGQNIATGATFPFTHNVPANFVTEQAYTVNVTISNVNGGGEVNTTDNIMSQGITITTAMITRKMIFENFTTGQCPNCPPVITYTENYKAAHPNAILIGLHSGYFTDAMTTPESEALMEFYNAGGSTYAPALMIDRHFYTIGLTTTPDPGPVFFPGDSYTGTTSRLDNQLANPAFVSVNINPVLTQAGLLTVTVTGNILANVSGNDLRVVVYLIEDGLLYPQAGQSVNPFTHNDVLRAAMPSTFGTTGSVPANTAGTTYNVTYTKQLPATWDPTKMHIIAFVANYDAASVNNREILNAEEVAMPAAVVNVNTLNQNIGIYPNPATDYINIVGASNTKVEIMNITGKVVLSQILTNNTTNVNLNGLSNGIYMVRVSGENTAFTKKIIIRK